MEYFHKHAPVHANIVAAACEPPPQEHDPTSQPPFNDTITSLMNMADKMEALLPPDCDLSLPVETNATPCHPPPSHDNISQHSLNPSLADCLSSVTAATLEPNRTTKQETQVQQHLPLDIDFEYTRPHAQQQQQQQQQQQPQPHQRQEPSNITEVSAPAEFSVFLEKTPSPAPSPAPDTPNLPLTAVAAALQSASAKSYGPSHTSPCSVRDLRNIGDVTTLPESLPQGGNMNSVAGMGGVYKVRKTGRKPKTYSKPVASRFCHICSRMPRRGQGSATCRRMAEGFCRKIVCEQCLREQGWDYEDISANPEKWLCPHCADICPARSQCHIYNRINARRKRAGSGKRVEQASVAAALASSDVLLGPYGHLFNAGQTPQILQPPPNFRLNLPPQYSQL